MSYNVAAHSVGIAAFNVQSSSHAAVCRFLSFITICLLNIYYIEGSFIYTWILMTANILPASDVHMLFLLLKV